jgi:predicted AAA+ superfamily ATPase
LQHFFGDNVKRQLYKQLIKWKNNPNRKPLILQGARQVGKTYLVSEFGKKEYQQFIYLNFEQTLELSSLFLDDLIPENIIENISLYLGKKIDHANTLLFFDEIQAAPKALTSLKYFYEQAPEYNIIAAGSLLGVSVGKTISFPVGKVNFLQMYPMNFSEYLTALGEETLAQKIATLHSIQAFPELLHNKLIRHYKLYLYIGGMPEVVKSYIETKDISETRRIQKELLEAYKRDFSKYTEKNQAIKTAEVWQSIPYQLAKENKKFKYSDVRKKARASTFEQTIEWLKGAGLINTEYNISIPKLPLSGYADYSKFKIYLLDTGLLGAMLNLSSKMIIEPEAIFKEYNGAFIENYVAQELTAQEIFPLFYWTSKSDAEIDFIIEKDNKILPLEVKSGTNLNLKSLQSYIAKYKPAYVFRTSPRNFVQSNNFINIPLYAISAIKNII